MKKYGDVPLLKENQAYRASIRINGEEFSISFTSRYSPLFSSTRVIRGDFKDLFMDYNDDHINRLIHDNSKLVIDMTDGDEDEPTYAMKQYVRYKTEYDLATDIFVTLYTKSGMEDKQLADMRIAKQVNMSGVKGILDLLKARVQVWESEAGGLQSVPTSSVRAGASVYPYSGRVAF